MKWATCHPAHARQSQTLFSALKIFLDIHHRVRTLSKSPQPPCKSKTVASYLAFRTQTGPSPHPHAQEQNAVKLMALAAETGSDSLNDQ
jgi:hypothetical protein